MVAGDAHFHFGGAPTAVSDDPDCQTHFVSDRNAAEGEDSIASIGNRAQGPQLAAAESVLWEAETKAPHGLQMLDASILCRLWPAERWLVGVRTCKAFEAQLQAIEQRTDSIAVSDPSQKPSITSLQVKKSFSRLQNGDIALSLAAKQRCPELVRTVLDGVSMAGAVKNLVSLSLEYCRLGRQGTEVVRSLSGVLEASLHLTHLNLKGNQLRQGHGIVVASSLHVQRLASLNLGWNLMGDDAIKRLCLSLDRCDTLTLLHLGGNNFRSCSAAVAALVARNKQLSSLDLGRNNFGTMELGLLVRALQGHTQLERLVLRDCRMDDETLQPLVEDTLLGCPRLRYLDLRCHAIADDGFTHLAEALGAWPQLQHLDVSKRHYAAHGVERGMHALLQSMHRHHVKAHVDLRFTGVGGHTIHSFDVRLGGRVSWGNYMETLQQRGRCELCEELQGLDRIGAL